MVEVADAEPFESSFVGRVAELNLVRSCIEVAAANRSRVVWVEGEAGSGKTVLVRRALDALPSGFQVLRAQADELTKDTTFAVVAQLGEPSTEVPFIVGMQLLDSWARLQEQGPVVVVVEDLHWADAASRQSLLTAARRLDRDQVAVVITSRPNADDEWGRLTLDEARCRRISLGPFDVDEVAALAASSGVALTYREAERLHRHTQGHPLYVRTLLVELTPDELRTTDVDLPAPRSLASTTIARLSGLSVDAQDLAAAMAVVNQRLPIQLVGRIAGVRQPTEAFEELMGTRFVDWHPEEPETPIEFSHPLHRQALYQDLSPSRRRDLHRAAAQVLPAASALSHRVASTEGSDDHLADELEAAARSEIETGSIALGSQHLLWASSLSGGPEDAERRLIEATWVLLGRGQLVPATALLPRVEACRDCVMRSLVLGMIHWEQGESALAERWLLHAVTGGERTPDIEFAVRARAELSVVYAIQGRAPEAMAAAEIALSAITAAPSAQRLAWIGLAMAEGLLRGAPAGIDILVRHLPQQPEQVSGADADLLATRGTLNSLAGRTTSAVADMRGVIRLARQGSVAIQISRAHIHLAALLVNTGDWDEALMQARLGLSIVTDERLVWMDALASSVVGTIEAYRGEWSAAVAHLAQASESAERHHSLEALLHAQVARAALSRAQHQPDQVIETLVHLPGQVPMLGALPWWPTLINALIDVDQVDRAENSLAELVEAAEIRGLDLQARVAGLRARLTAARGQPNEAIREFEGALRLWGADDPYLDRAQLHHDYGRLLCATGDRRRAVAHFRNAHQLLSRAGASPFLERVDVDLVGIGIRQATGSTDSILELTERERDVAHLVAKGLTNPEVGAELYISRKAVEYHLRNIFGKLGIQSRRELRAALV